jgi:hypothetical protein
MLDDTTPGWKQRVPDPERLLQSLISSITCDLCNEISTRTGYGWTCKSGPHTVLHPAAYDICESCFEKHCNFHFSAAMRLTAVTDSCGHQQASFNTKAVTDTGKVPQQLLKQLRQSDFTQD